MNTSTITPPITTNAGYVARVMDLEAEGLTTSDAQAVADLELATAVGVSMTSLMIILNARGIA